MAVNPLGGLTQRQFQNRIIRDPEWYIREVLGQKHVWDKELEIVKAVLDGAQIRTAVRGCVSSGKTVAGAIAVHAFMDAFGPECEVYTTAPTYRQTQKFLWKHIRLIHKRAKIRRGGTIPPERPYWKIDDDWFALGFSPKDPDTVHGAHAPNILILIDEMQGVKQELIEAAENALAGGNARMLGMFNPNADPGDEAYECAHKKQDIYNNIKISAYDTPNVKAGRTVINGMIELARIKEWEKTYGRDSNFFRVKVLAEYPYQSEDALYPMTWIEKAMKREASTKGRRVIGSDVARGGKDTTSIVPMHGRAVQEIIILRGKDGVQVASRLKTEILERKAVKTFIDDIGVGSGPTDILRHDKDVTGIHGINVAHKAKDSERFDGLKAEISWGLRDAINPDSDHPISLPDDVELLAEMSAIRYDVKKGRIWVESKKELKKRLGKSPDKADGTILANYANGASVTIASASSDAVERPVQGDGARGRLFDGIAKESLARRRGPGRLRKRFGL